MFPETSPRVSGKQNSLFHEGPVNKCFVIPPSSKLDLNCEKMICLTLLSVAAPAVREGQLNRAVHPQ